MGLFPVHTNSIFNTISAKMVRYIIKVCMGIFPMYTVISSAYYLAQKSKGYSITKTGGGEENLRDPLEQNWDFFNPLAKNRYLPLLPPRTQNRIFSTPWLKTGICLTPSDTKQDLFTPLGYFFSFDPPASFALILSPSDSFLPPRTAFLTHFTPSDIFLCQFYPPRTFFLMILPPQTFFSTPSDIFSMILPPSDIFS